MDYEKKYKEALANARKEYNTTENVERKQWLEELFPELAESEDERIRKEILEFVDINTLSIDERHDRWISWLEKQGDKDKLIKELGEYKVKYTQEVLERHLNNMSNKDDERLKNTTIAFLKDYADKGYENAVECIDWLEKQESVGEIVSRCRTSWYNEGKIQGQIEGLTDDEKYQQGWHDALEKHGQQKSFNDTDEEVVEAVKDISVLDMVEPKFKVGDWVVCDVTSSVYQIKNCIENLSNHRYGYDLTNGGYIGSDEDNHYHLWTIQDAKDGDVLAEDTCIFIIQKLGDNNTAAKTYCTLYNDGDFDDGSILYFDIDSTKPATKEQRDLLFQKMKEAGYEWNADKKELEKVEKKQELSEEDDYNLQCMTDKVTSDIQKGNVGRNNELIDWLKSLKDRVQPQPKQEWSEEDERNMNQTLYFMQGGGLIQGEKDILLDWLKSIKDRMQGKED